MRLHSGKQMFGIERRFSRTKGIVCAFKYFITYCWPIFKDIECQKRPQNNFITVKLSRKRSTGGRNCVLLSIYPRDWGRKYLHQFLGWGKCFQPATMEMAQQRKWHGWPLEETLTDLKYAPKRIKPDACWLRHHRSAKEYLSKTLPRSLGKIATPP